MSARKKLRCTCPCGYGFETGQTEADAIVMVQAHFNRFHTDMLPFGITAAEARVLITSINDIGNAKSVTRPLYPTDSVSTFSLENATPQGEPKRKKPQIIIP